MVMSILFRFEFSPPLGVCQSNQKSQAALGVILPDSPPHPHPQPLPVSDEFYGSLLIGAVYLF